MHNTIVLDVLSIYSSIWVTPLHKFLCKSTLGKLEIHVLEVLCFCAAWAWRNIGWHVVNTWSGHWRRGVQRLELPKPDGGVEVGLLNALALGTSVIVDEVHRLFIILVIDVWSQVVVETLLVEVLTSLCVRLLLLGHQLLRRFISEIQVLNVNWFRLKSYAVHVNHDSVFII